MSAYDKDGKLLRARRTQREDEDEMDDEQLEQSEEEIERQEIEQGLSDEQRARNAAKRESRRGQLGDRARREGIPKEGPMDLRPYPLNKNFVSQPVLSEELREELYQLVAAKKLRPEDVAAAFRVDVRRVAAVVRLKTIEKQWMQEVSLSLLNSMINPCMMIPIQNIRLVLKTNTWLENNALRASLTAASPNNDCAFTFQRM